MNLKEALEQLNTLEDDHWTDNGLPRVDILKGLTRDDQLTRGVITKTYPNFTRENPIINERSTEDDTTGNNTETISEMAADSIVNSENDSILEDANEEGLKESDEIKQQLKRLKPELAQLNLKRNSLDAEYSTLQVQIEGLEGRLLELEPATSPGETICAYLAAMRVKNDKEAARIRQLKASGFDIRAITSLIPETQLKKALDKK